VREALARLGSAVEDCQVSSLAALTDDDILSCLDECAALVSRVAAVQARIVQTIEVRGIARSVGASSTRSLVRDRLRLSPFEAKRLCSLAASLDALDLLGTAVAEGRVNVGQAEVIAASIEELPTEIGAEAHIKAEAHLIDLAAQFDPVDLRKLGRHLVNVVDPDWADRHAAEALRREEERAYAARGFSLATDHLTGRTRISGWLDSESAAVVRAALDPLCAPGARTGRMADADGTPAIADERTPAQRRADALVDLCRLSLASGELPANGGDRPQVTVTLGFDPLTRALGLAALDTGEFLSPEAARRIACDAQLIPAVLDSNSAVLDLGREQRLWVGSARRAIMLRDRGCAFPGCDRPPRWTQIHHIRHWVEGGETDQANGVALCGHHHRVIHQQEWHVEIAGDGYPSFTPPAWIDAQQRPRRNTFHRRP
jgi:hypothetical protein